MELNADLIARLSSPNIEVGEFRAALKVIDVRVEEVWRYIDLMASLKMRWWGYPGDEDEDGHTAGSFMTALTQNGAFVEICGDRRESGLDGFEYDEGFPTRFLWEDYQPVVRQHVEECRERTRLRKERERAEFEEKEQTKRSLRLSIRKKLTPEELKLVKFV